MDNHGARAQLRQLRCHLAHEKRPDAGLAIETNETATLCTQGRPGSGQRVGVALEAEDEICSQAMTHQIEHQGLYAAGRHALDNMNRYTFLKSHGYQWFNVLMKMWRTLLHTVKPARKPKIE
jgi:hypothetical protein